MLDDDQNIIDQNNSCDAKYYSWKNIQYQLDMCTGETSPRIVQTLEGVHLWRCSHSHLNLKKMFLAFGPK